MSDITIAETIKPQAQTSETLASLKQRIDRSAKVTQLAIVASCLAIIAYSFYAWHLFELGNIPQKLNPERASLFLLDTYAHKDHVTMRWKEPDKIKVSFEGERLVYNNDPTWLERKDQSTIISFQNGGLITIQPTQVIMDWPGFDKAFTFKLNDQGKPFIVGYQDRLGDLPDFMRQTKNKVEVRPSLYERLQVGTSKVEIHRYSLGWKFFWFDFNSPLKDMGLLSALKLVFDRERVVPEQSNAALVLTEFLNNRIWNHGAIFYAMVETLFMAVLGTMIAAGFALPFGFMAAKNVQPVALVRFVVRRFFDICRGIDTLLWSLIFLRAFGPGLFTGIFAIALADIGALGKMMSEAIENADDKQRDGVQSTGASKIQQYRFGIIPQILPVFVSQSLYFLESNTRGAVMIGAMGAGGIGLQFLGALQTGNDFENVAYMSILILIAVILIDGLSSKLRAALIGRDR